MMISLQQNKPIRVFRSSKLKHSPYSPAPEGKHSRFRYDGQYMIAVVNCNGSTIDNVSAASIPLSDQSSYLFTLERSPQHCRVNNEQFEEMILQHVRPTKQSCPEECKAGYYDQEKKRRKGNIPHALLSRKRTLAPCLELAYLNPQQPGLLMSIDRTSVGQLPQNNVCLM